MKTAKIEKEGGRFWLTPAPDLADMVLVQEFAQPDVTICAKINGAACAQMDLVYKGASPQTLLLRNDFASWRLAVYDDTKTGRFDDMIQKIYACVIGADFALAVEPGRAYRIIGVQ